MVAFLILASNCKKDKDDDNNNPVTPSGVTVTDTDGNVYHTVIIGEQVWMSENLKTTKYRNGNPIPKVSDGTTWSNHSIGAYCNYNKYEDNSTTYGRLYNWYAVNDSRNIAPTGWHIPSDAEWTTLTTYLGGECVAGGNLKETGITHWQSPNTGATNKTGFTALPGGYRHCNGDFFCMCRNASFWSSTEHNCNDARYRKLGYDWWIQPPSATTS